VAKVAALATAVLLASNSASAETTIKLWHSYSKSERDGLTEALAAFAKTNPGFTVEASFVPYDALVDKLSAAIPRGHGPDVFVFAHDRVGGWAEGGLIEPIELYVDEQLLDRHATPCIFALAYGESLYGLPLAYKSLALFVRTDRVASPPATFEELLEAAKKESKPGGQKYGLFYANADLFFHSPLLFSLGGTIFSKDSPAAPNVVNEGVIASLALARRLAVDEHVLPEDPTAALASGTFSEGRTPFVINGPWFRGEIDRDVKYTVVPLPPFPGGTPSSGFSTCEGLLLSRKSTHKKEAFELVRFLTSDLASAKARMITGGQTVTLEEAWSSALPSLPESEQAIFRAFRKAFEQSVTTPSHPSMNAVWTPMNAALYKTIHQGMDPAAAAREAQERIDRALGAGK
jgi:maltose-binding protein MalE